LVDPYDINDIAKGIAKALEKKEELARKGFVQAAKFSWEKTAQQTIDLYEKIFFSR
jgi:glycosyltransferase involved in cell wall biosynthesis